MPDQVKKLATDCTLDVFGKTPFEHELTSDPVAGATIVRRPLLALGTWRQTTGTVSLVPALPAWMRSEESR